MDNEKKLRSFHLSEEAWNKAKEAGQKTKPASSRPSWIENAILEQYKRESENGKD
jgi:hypothetical protein